MVILMAPHLRSMSLQLLCVMCTVFILIFDVDVAYTLNTAESFRHAEAAFVVGLRGIRFCVLRNFVGRVDDYFGFG